MKVGIIGLGFRLSHVMKEFSKADDSFSVVGYYDPAPAGLPNLHSFGIAPGQAFASVDALLAHGGMDVVLVGSPNFLHLEHVGQALAAGYTVFTEKPVVINEEQTMAMAKLVRQYGEARILVGLVLRYSPLYHDLLAARDAGQLRNHLD